MKAALTHEDALPLARMAKYFRDQQVEQFDLTAVAGTLKAAAEGIQQRGKPARVDTVRQKRGGDRGVVDWWRRGLVG